METGMTAAAMYVPELNEILGTLPVSYKALLYTLPILPIMFIVEELRKLIIRTWPKSKIGYALLA